MLYYNIHDIVEVLIDPMVGDVLIRAIDFQISYFRKNIESDTTASKRIMIKPYNDISIDRSDIFHKFHLSRGIQGVSFHDPLSEIFVEKNDGGFTIYSNSPNFLINLYIQILLMENSYSMVHAAAIADAEGHVTLLPGAGGVGKTSLLGSMVEEYGFKYMGDDVIILGKGGNCLSFPRFFVLKEYHRDVYPEIFQKLNIKKRSNLKIKRFIVENAPFTGILKKFLKQRKLYYKVAHSINLSPYLATVSVEEIFGSGTCAQAGNVEKIVFLERYEGTEFKLKDISEDALCRRMFAIIHHEWVAGMQQFFTISAMEIIDLHVYFNKVYEIIKSGISNIPRKMLLIPEDADHKALVASYLELSQNV